MTVRELIDKLKVMPADLPIALSVYRHDYGSEDHRLSHGELKVLVDSANGIRQSVFLKV